MARGITIYLAKTNNSVREEREIEFNEWTQTNDVGYVYNFDTKKGELFIRDSMDSKMGTLYQLLYTNSFTSVMMDIADILCIQAGSKKTDTTVLSFGDALDIQQAIHYCIDFHNKDKDKKIKKLLKHNKFISMIEELCIYDCGYCYEWKCFAEALNLCVDFVQTNENAEWNNYSIYINAWG